MHEMSLCENVRDVLEAEAVQQGFGKVIRVWLDVGPFSCVEPEALRFGFEVVMRGSVAEGAALEIASPPAEGRCPACHGTAPVTQRFAPCPDCGLAELQVTGGDALKIRKLEVM